MDSTTVRVRVEAAKLPPFSGVLQLGSIWCCFRWWIWPYQWAGGPISSKGGIHTLTRCWLVAPVAVFCHPSWQTKSTIPAGKHSHLSCCSHPWGGSSISQYMEAAPKTLHHHSIANPYKSPTIEWKDTALEMWHVKHLIALGHGLLLIYYTSLHPPLGKQGSANWETLLPPLLAWSLLKQSTTLCSLSCKRFWLKAHPPTKLNNSTPIHYT